MTLNSQCQGFITVWQMCNNIPISGFWVEGGMETQCEYSMSSAVLLIPHKAFILFLSSSSLNFLQKWLSYFR